MNAAAQHTDHSAEARRATFEQFSALPPEKQTAFLQQTYAQPELRTNPELLHTAMMATVQEHTLGKHKLELEALLQLSPQLVPTGPQAEKAQEAALAQQVAVTQTTQVEVKQALDRGESIDQIKANAKSTDNVTQVAVATVTQEHKEKEHQQKVADNDAHHRLETGLAQPEQAHNPLAAALAKNAGAALEFAASLGGHRQEYHSQVSGPAGGKAAPEAGVRQV